MGLIRWILTYVAFWLALPFLLTHRKLRAGIRRRLGLYPANWLTGAGPRVWVHGASAGDVLALLPTVRALKRARPDVEIVASTITNSGQAMASRHTDCLSAVTYAPYDLPGAVRRTLQCLRPDVLVLEYTELWPNLIRLAHAHGVRVVLHNGRLAEHRMGGYRRLFALTGNLLQPLSLLLMRDAGEAERALALGAPESRVHVTGNTKFDNLAVGPHPGKVDELRSAAGFASDTPIWVAGSTHDGEEELLLDVFAGLREQQPELRLIIAPRYIERADRIAHQATRRGFKTRLRSQTGATPDVLILDTIGELSACYSLATLVFVGGSFVPRGGQNILEPAACGKPVIFGPHMQNFADSVQVLLGRGGIQVASPEQLLRVMADLLERQGHRQQLGQIARNQVGTVRGAATRNAGLIGGLLPQSARIARAAN